MDTGSYQRLVASHLPCWVGVGSVQKQQIICATFSFQGPSILYPPRCKRALGVGVGVALQPLGIWGSAGAQVCYTKANLVSAYWVYLEWGHPLSPSPPLAPLAHQIWP